MTPEEIAFILAQRAPLSESETRQGVYTIGDRDAYHGRSEPSYSSIKRAIGRPIAAYYCERRRSPSRQMIVGSAIDRGWEIGAAWADDYAVQPESTPRWTATKAGKKWKAETKT